MMRRLIAVAASLFPLALLAQEGARIALPNDFRTSMQHYASVDRADGITYRLYINEMALDTWREERRLPSGTIFAIENFLAATDAEGRAQRDDAGRLVPGESLNDVHVAMKSASWADDGPQTTTAILRGAASAHGTWRMAGFDPRNGEPTPDLNLAECHTCHLDPRAEDFHLSRGLLDGFVRTGTPAFISFTCVEREICFGAP